VHLSHFGTCLKIPLLCNSRTFIHNLLWRTISTSPLLRNMWNVLLHFSTVSSSIHAEFMSILLGCSIWCVNHHGCPLDHFHTLCTIFLHAAFTLWQHHTPLSRNSETGKLNHTTNSLTIPIFQCYCHFTSSSPVDKIWLTLTPCFVCYPTESAASLWKIKYFFQSCWLGNLTYWIVLIWS